MWKGVCIEVKRHDLRQKVATIGIAGMIYITYEGFVLRVHSQLGHKTQYIQFSIIHLTLMQINKRQQTR